MLDKMQLLQEVEDAAKTINYFGPLKNFIASNPLAGLESLPFFEAVHKGTHLFNGAGLPSRKFIHKALKEGKIKESILRSVLIKYGREDLFEDIMSAAFADEGPSERPREEDHISDKKMEPKSEVNGQLIKYLSLFLDEGQAVWPMPHREKGFYSCWKLLAVHDSKLKAKKFIKSLPDSPLEVLGRYLEGLDVDKRKSLLERHLVALPGWAGHIKWRAGRSEHHPISLVDYLAVRMAMADIFKEAPAGKEARDHFDYEGFYCLEAWEESYREELFRKLLSCKSSGIGAHSAAPVAHAQFVFCIDVRSEVFRRHLERTGNYETFGLAGFFGIPIRHWGHGEKVPINSCPVLLSPKYETKEHPIECNDSDIKKHNKVKSVLQGLYQTFLSLKQDFASHFATVETTGSLFGVILIGKTFFPHKFKRLMKALYNFFIPSLKVKPFIKVKGTCDLAFDLDLSDRLYHAESALRTMGLTEKFSPYVFLCGHGSETTNNPYKAGLDCGACGGNPGGPNAKIMADLFNDPEVRLALKGKGIFIPAETVFLAAQHNTTTDDLVMFDSESLPKEFLGILKRHLKKVKLLTNLEKARAFTFKRSYARRATDWAEVRPEWGLARNASFIVGPRSMTKDIDLEGRAFLHSYDWRKDIDGRILETILSGPMVVAQWINTQYYFSTVDNSVYGSGSKVTHNIVGKIGVMQGISSDLMTGLPLQSLMISNEELYHEPLRLLAVIQAPLSRIKQLVEKNAAIKKLFENDWMALAVLDPTDKKIFRYFSGHTWKNISQVGIRSVSRRSNIDSNLLSLVNNTFRP